MSEDRMHNDRQPESTTTRKASGLDLLFSTAYRARGNYDNDGLCSVPQFIPAHGADERCPFQGGTFMLAISPKKATARSGSIAAIVIPHPAG